MSVDWYGPHVLRAATVARLICLALILGVLVLHIPLDALRAQADDGRVASSCCQGGATDCAEQGVGDDASAPAPTDGCDQGCHCGCCGGLPLAPEAGPSVGAELPGASSAAFDRRGARRDRPLDVFHPPRA